MAHVFRVGAYVKLAKLWERSRDVIVAYQQEYHAKKYADNPRMRLHEVYIDITGQKHMKNRPAMMRLLRDCKEGKVDCIAAQTIGYLAADVKELTYLIRYLFSLENWVEIITEANNLQIDTIANPDNQRETLEKMAADYTRLNIPAYEQWKKEIDSAINKVGGG